MRLARPATPQEYAVLAIVIATVLIGLGLLGLVVAFLAPPDRLESAQALSFLSCWSLGIGVLVAAAYRIARRWNG
jgi:hypothetical protein